MSPRFLDRLRRAAVTGPHAPWAADTALALVVVAVSLLSGLTGPAGRWQRLDAAGVLLTCAVGGATVLRRSCPIIMSAVCAAGWVSSAALGYGPVAGAPAPMLMVYTVAARCPPRAAVAAAGLLSAVWVAVAGIGGGAAAPGTAAQGLVVSGALWKSGDSARRHAARRGTGTEGLRRQERERRAVARERLRITRELHEVVADHLSVVSVQAGLARYVMASDRETAGRALDTVLSANSQALEELRRALTLFPPVPPQPYPPAWGLRELPALAAVLRASGLDVEVSTTGSPYRLAAGVDLCAYRVVQESLVNVLRHAPGARAALAVGYAPGRLTVEVSDDGPGRAGAPEPVPGGGLLGMRERARLYGGTLTAGPGPQGGFTVRLVLPVGGGTARDTGESPHS